jgi:hypothetical protein
MGREVPHRNDQARNLPSRSMREIEEGDQQQQQQRRRLQTQRRRLVVGPCADNNINNSNKGRAQEGLQEQPPSAAAEAEACDSTVSATAVRDFQSQSRAAAISSVPFEIFSPSHEPPLFRGFPSRFAVPVTISTPHGRECHRERLSAAGRRRRGPGLLPSLTFSSSLPRTVSFRLRARFFVIPAGVPMRSPRSRIRLASPPGLRRRRPIGCDCSRTKNDEGGGKGGPARSRRS